MMKVGYNLVVSTYWGDADGYGENVTTYENEKDAKFWAYVISAFYRRSNDKTKGDFKKFLEAVSAPVELTDGYGSEKKYSVISDVISAAIINLDYVPEEFKRGFLKEKLEGTELDTCGNIFHDHIGSSDDGEMDNTVESVKIIYIGELREISF